MNLMIGSINIWLPHTTRICYTVKTLLKDGSLFNELRTNLAITCLGIYLIDVSEGTSIM